MNLRAACFVCCTLVAGLTVATPAAAQAPSDPIGRFQVGVGAKLRLRLGGKFAPESGPALDVQVEVLFVKRGAYQDQLQNERVPISDDR